MKVSSILFIALRYLIALVLALFNLAIFYIIFTPLTLYSVYFLLSLFFNVSLQGISITLQNTSILLVSACIAGSAYYLLTILNLTTPMPLKKRLLGLVFSLLAFLIINILRIFIFSILLVKSFSLFNLVHLIVWYALSTIIVIAIWLAEIRIFKISAIPVYSDIKKIIDSIKT